MPSAASASSNPIAEFGLLVVLWGLSIGVVYWDLKRQFLPRRQTLIWLAIVALLPGVGFAVYLLSRLVGRAFPLPSAGAPAGTAKQRVTQFKRAPEAGLRTGTVAAAAFVQETISDRPVPPPMAVSVVVVAGPHAGQEFRVEALPASVGRGGEAALRLDRDLGVSRQHAEIYRQAGLLHIRDLSSTHGLLVNGVAVHDQAIAPSDKIEIGNSTFIIREAVA